MKSVSTWEEGTLGYTGKILSNPTVPTLNFRIALGAGDLLRKGSKVQGLHECGSNLAFP